MNARSRRRLLRVGVTALVAGMAGCLDGSTGGSGPEEPGSEPAGPESRTGSTAPGSSPRTESATPAGGEASAPYVRWSPAAAADAPTVPGVTLVSYHSLATVRAHSGSLGGSVVESVERRWRDVGTDLDVSTDRIDAGVRMGPHEVVLGSFDPASIATVAVDGGDYTQVEAGDVGILDGYRVFERPGEDDRRAFLTVSEESLVRGPTLPGSSPAESAGAFVAAATGQGERLWGADADFARLVEGIGGVDVGIVATFPDAVADAADNLLGDQTGLGVGWAIGGQETTLRIVYVFEDPSATDAEAVRSAVEGSGRLSSYGDPEVTVEGRGVRLVATAPTGRVDDLAASIEFPTGGESPPRPPEANFEFEVSGSTLRVTHAGGEPFTENDTSWLAVSVNEGCRGFQPEGEGCTNWDLPVEAGDTVEVTPVTSGDEVRMVWFLGMPRGELRRVVATYTVP